MMILPGHNERVPALAYSPDGRLLATGGCDWTVRLWDLATGESLHVMREPQRTVRGVVFSLDGRRILSRDNGVARVWELELSEPPVVTTYRTLTGSRREDEMDQIRATIGGGDPARLTDEQNEEIDARAWRLSYGHCSWLTAEQALRENQGLELPSLEGDRPAERPRVHFEVERGKNHAGTLCVFTSERGVPRGAFVPGVGVGAYGSTNEVGFAPGGQTLAYIRVGSPGIWTVGADRPVKLKGHRDQVRALAFSPDGRLLATAGYDGTVRLWEARDGSPVTCLDMETDVIDSLAFAPDGMTLAVGGRKGIVIVDAGEGF